MQLSVSKGATQRPLKQQPRIDYGSLPFQLLGFVQHERILTLASHGTVTRLGLAAAYHYLDSGVLPDTEPDCTMRDMDLALRSMATLPSVALEIGRQRGFLSTSTAAVGHTVSRLNIPIPSMLDKIELSPVVNAGVASCTPAAAIFQKVYVSSGPKLSNLFRYKEIDQYSYSSFVTS
jgi:hypothetical protein